MSPYAAQHNRNGDSTRDLCDYKPHMSIKWQTDDNIILEEIFRIHHPYYHCSFVCFWVCACVTFSGAHTHKHTRYLFSANGYCHWSVYFMFSSECTAVWLAWMDDLVLMSLVLVYIDDGDTSQYKKMARKILLPCNLSNEGKVAFTWTRSMNILLKKNKRHGTEHWVWLQAKVMWKRRWREIIQLQLGNLR